MSMQELDEVSRATVARFCRQYLQIERDLDYPPGTVLREEETQALLYDTLFAENAARSPPPQRYQLKVLKELVARVEKSIDDWDQHGVSDDLMSALSELLVLPLPSEIVAAQQKSYVTYALSHLEHASQMSSALPPSITLLESRDLIAAGGTTGLRTWEAALHLGQYLCKNPSLIQGKRVLELGAGTGYLAILCAKFLEPTQVIASDGSEEVVANLPDNFFVNGLQDSSCISTTELKWGSALLGTEEEKWNGGEPIDIVIGADITYDQSVIPALAAALDELFELFPKVAVLIAATERNRETFEAFTGVCSRKSFTVVEIDFEIPSRDQQNGPFYNDKVPIRICKVSR